MKDVKIKTTPKMTIHLDAHKFSHPLLDDDIVIGTSTETAKNKTRVRVITVNGDLPEGDFAPRWPEVLSELIGDLVSEREYKDDKVELDWEGIVNWIENSIYAELQKLGVQI